MHHESHPPRKPLQWLLEADSGVTGRGGERRSTPLGSGVERHTQAPRPQAIVSRMAEMSSSVVSGLTMAKRVTVSPSCEVGTTKANSSASSRFDHAA